MMSVKDKVRDGFNFNSMRAYHVRATTTFTKSKTEQLRCALGAQLALIYEVGGVYAGLAKMSQK